ncbi:MAG: DoxX family protein [Acidobacteriota bacterium]
MEKWLGKYSNLFYALMRIIAGFLFACHGAQKLFGVLGGTKQEAPLMIAAGVIEFIGGILIAVGLFAGYVAFIASGQMAVAYFMRHSPAGFWPITNRGELAVLFCFVFLYIASRGSRTLSIDALIAKARGAEIQKAEVDKK